jgi:hypothetical protein
MYNITYCKIKVRFRSGPGPTPRFGPLATWTWTYKFGSGSPSPGPDTRTYGFGPVRTQVREGQDRTPDSLAKSGVLTVMEYQLHIFIVKVGQAASDNKMYNLL